MNKSENPIDRIVDEYNSTKMQLVNLAKELSASGIVAADIDHLDYLPMDWSNDIVNLLYANDFLPH